MITLLPCLKNKKHAQIAYSWRNDPKTIASAYISLPKTWNSFWLEYQEGYFRQKELSPVFILENDIPVGFIRFEKTTIPEYAQETIAEVMINIAPEYRGEGIGTRALILAQEHLKEKGYTHALAEIKSQNKSSQKAFENAGFTFFKKRIEFILKTKENCEILCYISVL